MGQIRMHLQSHQAGIEIFLLYLQGIWLKTYNRTKLELKFDSPEFDTFTLSLQSHQAGIEIRSSGESNNLSRPLQSHQAGIEINSDKGTNPALYTYNRTKLELKLHIL